MLVAERPSDTETSDSAAQVLEAVPIEDIVTQFGLADQVTRASPGPVDGDWSRAVPLEELLTAVLSADILPRLRDVGPALLGLRSLAPGSALPARSELDELDGAVR